MRLTRCPLELPLAVGQTLSLPEETANHLVRVMRLREGDGCVLFNGDGCDYSATLVTATFTQDSYALTVTKAGAGAATGTVTSSPTGITCGSDCTEGYAPGTLVTLTATAGSGYIFTGWSGAGCSGCWREKASRACT